MVAVKAGPCYIRWANSTFCIRLGLALPRRSGHPLDKGSGLCSGPFFMRQDVYDVRRREIVSLRARPSEKM